MRALLSRALVPVARRPASCLAARRPLIAPRADPAHRSRGFVLPGSASGVSRTGAMQVHQFPCLTDNYSFLLHDTTTGATAVVDTPEVAPIEKALLERGWKLTHILNTHWHADHTGGKEELKKKHAGCVVIGPRGERRGYAAIPGMDISVGQDDTVTLGSIVATVIDVPGHTAGHVAYHFPSEQKIFVGDTLFAMGCGRLFEGKPATMWRSISKIIALPSETAVYCAHEYTLANAKFAISVDPTNEALAARVAEVEEARKEGKPTVPTTIEKELATNPFCRPDSFGIRETLGMHGAEDTAVFAETRRRKDKF
jgi:hydroxyacylglutathione hydrolase